MGRVIGVPLIVKAIVVIIVIAAFIVCVIIRATIYVLLLALWVNGNRRTRVPGLRVRCWRRRVVRIRAV
jgi:hypothetical protein